jgi:hypothetical protein
MDPMVVKYLGLAAITYGTHAFLAIGQVLLCILLISNGLLLLSSKEHLGKLATRFGLVINQDLRESGWVSWLMIATGISFILPLFGITYWVAVLACPVAIYLIINLITGSRVQQGKKNGNFMRRGLVVCAVILFGFTIWEGRDLIRAGWDVNYKAIYWRNKEVAVWQKQNNPNVPMVGELAPDFEVSDVTGTKSMRLSDFRGKKPVVLLFGSFT